LKQSSPEGEIQFRT